MASMQQYAVILLIITLSACGGKSTTKPNFPAPDMRASTPATQPAPTGKGGYYLDDGPGDNAPADIDSIPDAQLRTETPLARANKPYAALGQNYVPMLSYTPYVKQGVASWYGKRYHGKKTSSGEVYDMYAMTGAHTTLPIPSYARVTNPANGRSVIVRINDRGPFKHNRLIDLSYAAAYKLRLTTQGSGLVEVQSLDTSPEALKDIANKRVASASNSRPDTIAAATQTASESATPPENPDQHRNVVAVPIAASPIVDSNTPASGYYVQAGAFKNELNGNLLQKKIMGLNLASNANVVNVYNDGLYRVKVGPFDSRKDADITANKVRKQLNISAIVTNQ